MVVGCPWSFNRNTRKRSVHRASFWASGAIWGTSPTHQPFPSSGIWPLSSERSILSSLSLFMAWIVWSNFPVAKWGSGCEKRFWNSYNLNENTIHLTWVRKTDNLVTCLPSPSAVEESSAGRAFQDSRDSPLLWHFTLKLDLDQTTLQIKRIVPWLLFNWKNAPLHYNLRHYSQLNEPTGFSCIYVSFHSSHSTTQNFNQWDK